MKNLVLLASAIFLSGNLLAQNGFVGTWNGKTMVDGQQVKFKLTLGKNGKYSMAYDLNPNDLSYKGTWSHKNGVLTFKGSDEELQLRRSSKTLKHNRIAFKMEFRKGQKKMVYVSNIGMPPTLMGWDGGVAAVVINHEEQYN